MLQRFTMVFFCCICLLFWQTCGAAMLSYQVAQGGSEWGDETVSGGTAGDMEGTALSGLLVNYYDSFFSDLFLSYQVYLRDQGWSDWEKNGEPAGDPGNRQVMEAFRVVIQGKKAQDASLQYQAFVKGRGWLDLVSDGENTGIIGKGKEITALRLYLDVPETEILPKPFSDEAALLTRMGDEPDEAALKKLARLRYERAVGFADLAAKQQDNEAFEMAMSYAESAVDLAPNNGEYHLLAAILYFQVRHDPSAAMLAEASLDRVLALDKRNEKALLMMAELMVEQGFHEEALEYFELYAASYPGELNAPFISMSTTAYAMAGLDMAGIRFYQSILAGTPDNAAARVASAILLHHESRTPEALAELAKVRMGTNKRYRLYASQLADLFIADQEAQR